MIQYIIVTIIVAGAAWMLWRSLRRRGGTDDCADCPVRDACTRRSGCPSCGTAGCDRKKKR